jgi:serine/threonine protein kinase
MRERPDHGRLPRMDRDLLPAGRTDRVIGGRYRLDSQVGAGGTAVVWQAYDTVFARTVAVKVLAAHCADDPQSRDRIRNEARAAAALSHPNIAQVMCSLGEGPSPSRAAQGLFGSRSRRWT